jgi:hypothetical protein
MGLTVSASTSMLTIASTQHAAMPSSTGSYGSMVAVNGPVAKTIGMNSGVGAMRPFNYANSVIGRAWTLMSINFGDARAGDTFMATVGNGLSFTNQCCAENEGKSSWVSFHVRKGFKASESTVSIFRGWNVVTLGLGTTTGLLQSMKTFASMGTYTFVVDPLAAKNLKAESWSDPDKRSKGLAEKSGSPFPIGPEGIDFIVVGGETNPIVHTIDYVHYKTAPVDTWIPKSGIKLDKKPLRTPAYQECEDELCILGRK